MMPKVAAPITAQEAATFKLDTRVTNGAANVDNAFEALERARPRATRRRLPPVERAAARSIFVGGDLIVEFGRRPRASG
jgi:hypothetical protein